MMNKAFLVIIVGAVLAVLGYVIASRYGDVAIFKPSVDSISTYEECVKAGYPVLTVYPNVCKGPLGKSFVQNAGNGADLQDEISLEFPRPGNAITSPVRIKGKARGTWFFEGSFPVEILDEKGVSVLKYYATARDEWMTTGFVDFDSLLEFAVPPGLSKGTLVLKQDDPSGMRKVKELRVPVLFTQEFYKGPDGQNVDGTFFDVFFGIRGDHEQACDLVVPVKRLVPQTQGVARAALEELLLGPSEKESGLHFTFINKGVRIQSLSVKDGVARVDFSEELEKEVGGSCRVSAIRAQITRTLKQFSSVKDVIISVNGRTEDILQP